MLIALQAFQFASLPVVMCVVETDPKKEKCDHARRTACVRVDGGGSNEAHRPRTGPPVICTDCWVVRQNTH